MLNSHLAHFSPRICFQYRNYQFNFSVKDFMLDCIITFHSFGVSSDKAADNEL